MEDRHIIIIGNSAHFINEISKITKNIEVISWRNPKFKSSINANQKEKIIYICGYDYSSYKKNYEIFININVYNILDFIKKIKNIKQIYYINTIIKNKRTFSRYVYAKALLNEYLNEKYGKLLKVIECPTIIDQENNPIINGNKLNRLIFKILINYKMLNTIKINEIIRSNKIKKNTIKIKGVGIKYKRTQLIDRILRFILG